MRRVILDSNFLFIPFQFQIDILKELENLLGKSELVVLSTTLDELRNLAREESEKTRRQASLALKLAEKCAIVSVGKDPAETYDDVILRKAKEWICPVATNDRNLRKRLRREAIPTIYVRQRKKLELEGYV